MKPVFPVFSENEEMRTILEALKEDIFDLKVKARRKREAKLEAQRLQKLIISVEAKRHAANKAAIEGAHQLLYWAVGVADDLTNAQNEVMSKTMNDVSLKT